jgi:hypothetical protein
MANPYRITGPVDAGLNLDRGLQSLEGLFGLQASSVAARISGSADLKSFGLAEPWSTATVSGTPDLGDFSLRVSAPGASGNVFIHRDGVPLIYSAPASDLPWLSLSWFDLMDKLILIPFIDRVASVAVKTPERTVAFSLSGEGDALAVKAGDITVDTAIFRAYYQILLTAMYDEYAEVSPASLSEPFLEIEYRYRDGGAADTVGFYRETSLFGTACRSNIAAASSKERSVLSRRVLSSRRVRGLSAGFSPGMTTHWTPFFSARMNWWESFFASGNTSQGIPRSLKRSARA